MFLNCGPTSADDTSLVSGLSATFQTFFSSVDGEADRRFNSHRWGRGHQPSFTYTLPVSQPRLVTLGFAEVYGPNCAVNKRRFTVAVNGEIVSENLDVFASVGCRQPLRISVVAEPLPGGQIAIEFKRGSSGIENPFVSYIELSDPPLDS